MRIRDLMLAIGLLLMSTGAYGCWHQFNSPQPPPYQQFTWIRPSVPPLDAKYPGNRTLMDAPSNDPALNPFRDELRP
jgi:hypothetical protein